MCKNCECHEYLNSRGLGYDGDYRDKGHWCMHIIRLQDQDGDEFLIKDKKYISTNEFKETPEWCPKKLNIYNFEGIECNVIEIKSGIFK